jgi:APA family basic amino acid/polyamine antiporter
MENNQTNSTPESLIPRLGLFTATMIVIGSIIGSGIFKKIAPMSLKLQSESLVIWAWVIAGVITLFGALTYAEIAGRLAQTGGLYAYIRSMYGKFAGYIYGWSCFSVIQSASIASIAYVFAEALFSIFPFSFYGVEVKLLAICTILGLTLINYVGLIFGAWVENIFTVLKIIGISLVAIFAFMYGSNAIPVIANQIAPEVLTPTGLALIPVMFSAMLGAFWAFDGLNNIGFIGGEVKNAKRNVPLALIIGVIGILGIYLAVNLAYFHALALEDILTIAQMPGKIFAIEMINQISGASAALLVSILIMVSTFGATNGSILTSARIYYAMARDGVFFKPLGITHPKFNTPSASLVIQGLWASVLICSGSFDELTDMLIFVSFIFYGLGAWGLLRLRKQNIGTPRFVVPTIIPLLYALFCITLVVVTIFQNPGQALVGLLLTLAGIPLYFWCKK